MTTTTITTKKITLTTVKSFIKKNEGKLFLKCESSFSGMSDMVEFDANAQFKPVTKTENNLKITLGVDGLFIAGNWNLYNHFENDQFVGIEIYNCCGTDILAIKK